ncbi:MAG: EAL domain-containing protein [Ectothiorhodospiraceae bacterium]|nr:EAL domain-containing protein [Ectothiorhodospiraceae bacterium]
MRNAGPKNPLTAFLTGNIVNISVSVGAVIAAFLGLLLAQDSWRAYRAIEEFTRVQDSIDALLAATDAQARERGLTAALMSAPERHDATLPSLTELRAEVDTAWDSTRERVDAVLARSAGDHVAVARRFDSLTEALYAVRALRHQIDTERQADSGPAMHEEWIETTSALNAQAVALREELMFITEAPPEVARLNFLVNSKGARAAEYAGQVRGLLAYYAEARQPMPASLLEHTHFAYRRSMNHLSELLLAADAQVGVQPPVAAAINDIHAYRTEFERAGTRMLESAAVGDYPLNVGQWWTVSTSFINLIHALTTQVSEQAIAQLRSNARAYAVTLTAYLAIVAIAAILAMLSLLHVRRNAQRVFVEKEMSETILASIGDAVVVVNADGSIHYLNPIAAELTGWPQEEGQGRPYGEIFTLYNRLHSSETDPVATCLEENRIVVLTEGHVLIARDGREIPIDDSCAPIRGPDGGIIGAVLVFASKERLRESDSILSYHASHDALTGLYNRRAFEQQLREALEDARTNGCRHVLAFIDLDNFKIVNDTAGHAAGDQMLRHVSFLMRRLVRESDVLGRLGGDEFALLLRHCTPNQAQEVARKLLDAVRDLRFPWNGTTFQTGLSIGLVGIDSLAPNIEALIRDADAACYTAKEKGRNHIHVYRADDQRLAQRQGHTAWAARLSEAIDENRLELFCQPIHPLKRGHPRRSEILLRMRGRRGGLIGPGAFIPAAERHGMMPDLDQWVIAHACIQAAPVLLRDQNRILNINLSGTTLSDPEIGPRIIQLVERHGVQPSRICFEVTETAAMASLDTAVAIMEELRAAGFSFALDDFGSGLSSLHYLKELPVDLIKIDGHFVRKLSGDPVAKAMVAAIVEIAGLMAIRTCAECVEDAETLAALEQMGVDYVQGYHLRHPGPLADCLPEYTGTQGVPDVRRWGG